MTDLIRLRDSNPLYSSVWRMLIQWWGNSVGGGWLPNPFDPTARKVGLRTYLRLANFKANHRKVVLADSGDCWVSLVTSANPHDASSAHSNVALRTASTDLARQVHSAEMEVVRLSGGTPPFDTLPDLCTSEATGNHDIAYLTESAIRDRILELINATESGMRLISRSSTYRITPSLPPCAMPPYEGSGSERSSTQTATPSATRNPASPTARRPSSSTGRPTAGSPFAGTPPAANSSTASS